MFSSLASGGASPISPPLGPSSETIIPDPLPNPNPNPDPTTSPMMKMQRSRFPLIRQISDFAAEEPCPVCFENVGSGRGLRGHLEDLRLGCRCAIHYECLILYFRNNLKDRNEIRTEDKGEGILCPYKSKCKALTTQIKSGSDSAMAASYIAAARLEENDTDPSSPSTRASIFNTLYCMTVEDMDTICDYGLEEDIEDDGLTSAATTSFSTAITTTTAAGGGGGGGGANAKPKRLNPSLLKRLQDVGCEPLSHKEVEDLRVWIKEKKQGVIPIDPNALDPYVKATTKGCPTCGFRSTHFHGHQCHHISPTTRGCPHCHVSYCYKCLSTEKENLKARGSNNVCKCGYWSNFCVTITSKAEVKAFVIIEDGVPKDKRCGCTFCTLCRYHKPCNFCSGDCSVCRGVVKPGPMSIDEPWELDWAPTGEAEVVVVHDLEHTKFRLWECCRQGNLAGITANLTFTDAQNVTHNFINSQDAEGKTPLILCCENNHHLGVRALIAIANVNVNLPDLTGRTPLFYASTNGFAECINELFSVANINVNSASNHGHTPLYQAGRYNRASCVDALLKHATINPNATTAPLGSPIHVASFHGNSECVQLIAKHRDTDVNFADGRGRSSLLWACYYGHSGIISTLIGHKNINIDLEDNDGNTALYWAMRFSYWHCIDLISAKILSTSRTLSTDDPNFLFEACRSGDLKGLRQYNEIFKLQESKMKNINSYDRFGKTPFIYACENNQIDCVKALLSGEIFSNKQSNLSKREVLAEQIKSLEVQIANTSDVNDGALIDSLEEQLGNLRASLDVLSPDSSADLQKHGGGGGSSVTTTTATTTTTSTTNTSTNSTAGGGGSGRSDRSIVGNSFVGTISDFISTSASFVDINKGNKVSGYTPLQFAICMKHFEVVKVLLSQKHINVSAVTQNNSTAMHMACSFGAYEIIDLLLAVPSCDLLIRDSEGYDPFNLLSENKYNPQKAAMAAKMKPIYEQQIRNRVASITKENRGQYFPVQCIIGHPLVFDTRDINSVECRNWSCQSPREGRRCKSVPDRSDQVGMDPITNRLTNEDSNKITVCKERYICLDCNFSYCGLCYEGRMDEMERMYRLKHAHLLTDTFSATHSSSSSSSSNVKSGGSRTTTTTSATSNNSKNNKSSNSSNSSNSSSSNSSNSSNSNNNNSNSNNADNGRMTPFVASATHTGPRPGYVFRAGMMGVGYYIDYMNNSSLCYSVGQASPMRPPNSSSFTSTTATLSASSASSSPSPSSLSSSSPSVGHQSFFAAPHVGGTSRGNWSCSFCTFENHPDLIACEICEASKQSSSNNISNSTSASSIPAAAVIHGQQSGNGSANFEGERVVGSSFTNSDVHNEGAVRWGGGSSSATTRAAPQVPPVPPSRTSHPSSVGLSSNANFSSHNEAHARQSQMSSSSSSSGSSSSARSGPSDSLVNTSYRGPCAAATAATTTTTAGSTAAHFGATVTLTPTVTIPTEEFKKYARAADMDPHAFLLMRVEVEGGALQIGEEEEIGTDGRKTTIRRELFSYRDLLRRHVSRQLGSLNPAELEKHLVDSDFLKVFGVPKSEFKALPPHKKKSKKIAALLF